MRVDKKLQKNDDLYDDFGPHGERMEDYEDYRNIMD